MKYLSKLLCQSTVNSCVCTVWSRLNLLSSAHISVEFCVPMDPHGSRECGDEDGSDVAYIAEDDAAEVIDINNDDVAGDQLIICTSFTNVAEK
jgi:hypothetical protein